MTFWTYKLACRQALEPVEPGLREAISVKVSLFFFSLFLQRVSLFAESEREREREKARERKRKKEKERRRKKKKEKDRERKRKKRGQCACLPPLLLS